LKPELIQREQGIRSTIVVFGSARLHESAAAKQALRMPAGIVHLPNRRPLRLRHRYRRRAWHHGGRQPWSG
jgi:hypothetical protein